MSHWEFDVFETVVGSFFDVSVHKAAAINRRRALGAAIDRRFAEFPKGLIGSKKKQFVDRALSISRVAWAPKQWENRHSIIKHLKTSGQGDERMTRALCFLCCKIREFDDVRSAIGEMLGKNAADHRDVVGWPPTVEYHLNDILTGSERADPDNGASSSALAPVLTFRSSANRFHFSNAIVSVLGRDDEQKRLRSFLNGGPGFQWLQIAGVGGQGKSRLAYELILDVQKTWHAGFLEAENLAAFGPYWKKWRPAKPTLIVFDYVMGQEAHIKTALQALAKRDDGFGGQPVRLLLLERQRWDRGGIKKKYISKDSEEPQLELRSSTTGFAEWFLALCERKDGSDLSLASTRYDADGGHGVVELESLFVDDLIAITRSVARSLTDADLSLSDEEIADALDPIDGQGRPLYAYFLAGALANNTYQPGWTREDLLIDSLDREQRTRWSSAFGPDCPRIGDDTVAMRLAVLATMLDGFDNGKMTWPFDWQPLDRSAFEGAMVLVDGPRGSGAHFNAAIPSLQPDILGEWFVLANLSGTLIDYRAIGNAAWISDPRRMAVFLMRCAQDFPGSEGLIRLLSVPPPDRNSQLALWQICPILIANLLDAECTLYPSELIRQIEFGASETGDPELVALLGYCYLMGIGLEQNERAGFRLIERAAEALHSTALYNLGLCHLQGTGTVTDIIKAIAYFHLAAQEGDDSAREIVESFPDRAGIPPSDPSIAEWVRAETPIKWPMDELVAGEWAEASNEQSQALIHLLSRHSRLKIGQGASVEGLRWAKLSCFPKIVLVEVMLIEENVVKLSCALVSSDISVLLNGKVLPLQLLARMGHLSISRIEDAVDFARIYSTALCEDGVNHRIIERIESISLYKDVGKRVLEKIKILARPVGFVAESEDNYVLTGLISHKQYLYFCHIIVNKFKNSIEIGEEVPIAEEVPVYWEGFDGVFRAIWLPSNLDS